MFTFKFRLPVARTPGVAVTPHPRAVELTPLLISTGTKGMGK
jgi:hypothetical protein